MQSICVHSEKSQKTVYKDHYLEVASLHFELSEIVFLNGCSEKRCSLSCVD